MSKRSTTLPSGSSRGMAIRTISSIRARTRRNTDGVMLERDVFLDDIVIVVMGPTGVGKSNFIMNIMGDGSQRKELQLSGAGLKSFTSEIQLVRILNNPTYGDRIVIVDTPGFDDTHKSDMEILKLIGKWLERTYKNQVRLAGIFYLHRISDNRMSGSPRKNLIMFNKLTGTTSAHRVVFVTTMWDLAKESQDRMEVFEKRSEQLKRYWREAIENGARQTSFNNTRESAARCMNMLLTLYSSNFKTEVSPPQSPDEHSVMRPSPISEEPEEVELIYPQPFVATTALHIQEEIVEVGKRINETDAGKTLYSTLQEKLDETRKTIQELSEQARANNDSDAAHALTGNLKTTEAQFQRTYEDMEELKIPWWRKLMLKLPKTARTVFEFRERRRQEIEPIIETPIHERYERRGWSLPPFTQKVRERVSSMIRAPSMAPQISERNYIPQPRFRTTFRGTILSVPQTPTSPESLVSGLIFRDRVVGARREQAGPRSLARDLNITASPTTESPQKNTVPLPDPNPPISGIRKRVTLAV